MKLKNRILAVVAGSVGVMSAAVAQTTTPKIDLSAITGAISPGDITVGVLAICATLATVYATIKAAKIALGMLRGG